MRLPEYVDLVLAFVGEHDAWAPPIVFVLAFGESLAFVSLVLPFWGILVARLANGGYWPKADMRAN